MSVIQAAHRFSNCGAERILVAAKEKTRQEIIEQCVDDSLKMDGFDLKNPYKHGTVKWQMYREASEYLGFKSI